MRRLPAKDDSGIFDTTTTVVLVFYDARQPVRADPYRDHSNSGVRQTASPPITSRLFDSRLADVNAVLATGPHDRHRSDDREH